MCLEVSVIGDTSRWNWEGDRILIDAVLPSGRPVIGRTRPSYPIDAREFLVAEKNTVMRQVLRKDIPEFLRRNQLDEGLFLKRAPTAFDFRANAIAAFVAEQIRYKTRAGRDPWQFPDETLFLRSGDCEDIAFLIASLMLASGVSGYNVRVALGKLHLRYRHGRSTHHDHMWVMYKNEAGRWLIIEPLHFAEGGKGVRTRTAAASRVADLARADYEPRFLLNQDHVWTIERDARPETVGTFVQREWSRLDPKFAGVVHQSILNEALVDVAPDAIVTALNRHFNSIFGNVVDDVDNFVTMGYDPRDHFDNGFIDEGWAAVVARLGNFRNDNNCLDDFAYAAHGIADFYAHSSYLHFARLQNPEASSGRADPYDPANPNAGMPQAPAYDAASGFRIGAAPFTVNPKVYKGRPEDAPALWNGSLISGRYAQIRDSHSFLEGPVFIPESLVDASFPKRGALPHHEEIAVDSEEREKGHKLYKNSADSETDRQSYRNQFRWRRNTAVAHIRAAFQANWNPN